MSKVPITEEGKFVNMVLDNFLTKYIIYIYTMIRGMFRNAFPLIP